jgi:arylsulfatase A-like enzyme
MIENIDRQVGRFIDAVRQRGELDNTVIVYASDHGEMLGDHGLWAKRHPYHGSAGVPLILHGLDVRRGAICHDAATTLDLTATFLDYAGIARPEKMDSRSLRAFLSGHGGLPRDHALCGMDEWRLVMQGQYKYIRGWPGGPLLFDRRNDPHENDNLVASKPEVAARMEALLGSRK